MAKKYIKHAVKPFLNIYVFINSAVFSASFTLAVVTQITSQML